MEIVIGDVCGGTNTPAMVKNVMNWKENGGVQARELWGKLSCLNGMRNRYSNIP